MDIDAADLNARLRTLRRDTTIVIERNPRLAERLEQSGFFVLSVGPGGTVDDGQALADNWSALSCRSPNAVCIGSTALCRLVETLSVRARINGNTAYFRSRGWVENFLANFPALLEPSFGAYTNTLRGVPAFIVGAGASLDEDHDYLGKLHTKGLVIGINAAARMLPDGGVAFTVEGNDMRHKLGPLRPDIVRAFSLFADPTVMQHGDGPAVPIFTGELAAVPEWLTGYQRLACSALGGTAAFSLAERLGCDPIVLVGQEFTLKDGGRIYPECLGIGDTRAHRTGNRWEFDWSDELKAQKRQNPLHTEDLAIELPDGKWTTHNFDGTLRWFEQAARRLGDTRTCVQASAGATKLAFWENRALGSVLSELPDRQVDLSPAENGCSSSVLLTWLERQMEETGRLHDEAERMARSPTNERIAAVRAALRRSVLAEPWMHPTVADLSACRRHGAAHRNRWKEQLSGLQDASQLGHAIAAETPALIGALVGAAATIRALGGSLLEDCALAPGAADDLLRCALRSIAPYQKLSPFGKAASWLAA